MSSSSKGLKKGQLVEEEKMELGAIPPSTYLIYIQYAGGLIVMTIAFLLCLISVGSTGKFLLFKDNQSIIMVSKFV